MMCQLRDAGIVARHAPLRRPSAGPRGYGGLAKGGSMPIPLSYAPFWSCPRNVNLMGLPSNLNRSRIWFSRNRW